MNTDDRIHDQLDELRATGDDCRRALNACDRLLRIARQHVAKLNQELDNPNPRQGQGSQYAHDRNRAAV